MKMIRLSVIIFAVFILGCTQKESEERISSLKQEKSNLETEILDLQNKLDSLKSKSDSIQEYLSHLDMNN